MPLPTDFCFPISGNDKQDTVSDLRQIQRHQINSNHAGQRRDCCRVELRNVACADSSDTAQVSTSIVHGVPRFGCITSVQTMTVVILINSDRGVSTCSLHEESREHLKR